MASSSTVSAVSIKAPPFLEASPTAWFCIMEAQFVLSSVTSSSTKFYHILANLPPSIVANLSPTVTASQDYDALKTAVETTFEKSKPELFHRLLGEATITGRPSQRLAEMRRIAGQVGANEDLVRNRFNQILPSSIAPIIAAQTSTPLDDLGRLADELLPLASRCDSVLTVNSGRSNANRHNSSTNNSFGISPFNENQRPKVCRAHIYFGKNARTCRYWCEWPDKQGLNVVKSRFNSPANSRSNSPTKNNLN